MDKKDSIASLYASESHSPFQETAEHSNYYFFELQLIEMVRQGNIELLSRFLKKHTHIGERSENLAQDPLRQAKNNFISTITSVAKHGAIPGGLDVEETYQLIELYVQSVECEENAQVIYKLRDSMLFDLTERVGRSRLPEGISSNIFAALQYIHIHFSDGLSVEDIASHIGVSRSYLQKKFKEEIGRSIGSYIIDYRMREAQTLLKYSARSLSEISEALHFSSQAYFQNSFKKSFGMTPMEYRKQQGMRK